MLNAENNAAYQTGTLANQGTQIGNDFTTAQARLKLDQQGQEYSQSQSAHDKSMALSGKEMEPALTPAQSFQASQSFSQQPPEIQARGIDWAGAQIRQDPSRAGEIADLVGASDEEVLSRLRRSYKSPNLFVESDEDGDAQKTRIENAGLLADARGLQRPAGLKRKLPWWQEFLGFSYADPEYTGRTLSDLQKPSRR